MPLADAEAIYAAAKAKYEAETKQMAAIKAGKSDPACVDAELKKHGVEFVG